MNCTITPCVINRSYANIPAMPIIRSAIKKVRKDRLRTKRNLAEKLNIKKLIKVARKSPDKKTLGQVFSTLDKAVKHHLIHANKSARLKSRLAKLASVNGGKPSLTPPKKTASKESSKKIVKKTSPKKSSK